VNRNILLAGLFHETHTFLPKRTGVESFHFVYGEDLFSKRGDGSPIDGVLEVGKKYGWNLLPLLDARAGPSSTVEDAVFEQYWDAFEKQFQEYRKEPLDGIFLVLHGAMVTESCTDVEGELLKRIRAIPELQEIPIFAVIDLHANFSPAMAEKANAIIAYRRNPHTDSRETAMRAAEMMERSLSTSRIPCIEFMHSSILLSPLATGTSDEPMNWLLQFSELLKSHHPDVWEINVIAGFSYADTPHTGLGFTIVHDGNSMEAHNLLHELKKEAWRLKDSNGVTSLPADEVLKHYKPSEKGPVVFIESSDNIGGGTYGDATGGLRAMLAHKITNAAAVINDPETVKALSRHSPGDTCNISLGGKENPFDEGPVDLTCKLLNLSDGQFTLEDRHSHLASIRGTKIDMGPCATVECDGIQILITSRPTPPFDLGQLRSQGIVPEKLSAILVKAAVGHRQAYDPIAAASHYMETPGPCPTDLHALPYKMLPRPIYPLNHETHLNFKYYDPISSK